MSGNAVDYLPAQRDIERLASAARDCHRCSLYEDATQTGADLRIAVDYVQRISA